MWGDEKLTPYISIKNRVRVDLVIGISENALFLDFNIMWPLKSTKNHAEHTCRRTSFLNSTSGLVEQTRQADTLHLRQNFMKDSLVFNSEGI